MTGARTGVWADADTLCMRAIDDWTPARLDSGQHLVVGVEIDHARYLDPHWRRWGWPAIDRGYDLAQWAMRARRHSPAIRRALVLLATRVQQHGTAAPWSQPDILRATGPALWTDAVLETAACERHRDVSWLGDVADVADGASTRLGGALVLSRVAFNADDGLDDDRHRLVRHLFAGSWRPASAAASWWPPWR